jgi:hypothetical protein
MSAGRRKLSDREESAIAALLVERTHALAAAKAGIGEATLARWLREEAFAAVYKAARRSLFDSAIASLQRAGGEAVEALQRGLKCGNSAVEIRAAALILEHGFKGLEVLDLVDRVEEIETRLMGVRDGKPLESEGCETSREGAGGDGPEEFLEEIPEVPDPLHAGGLGGEPVGEATGDREAPADPAL